MTIYSYKQIKTNLNKFIWFGNVCQFVCNLAQDLSISADLAKIFTNSKIYTMVFKWSALNCSTETCTVH